LVYIRCRLDIPFPILEVAPEPAAGHAVTVGPLRGRRLALELVEQLDSLFGLRHCGRRLPRREHPSAYGQMGRCLSPCLGDLDPNLYRRRLDAALALFVHGDCNRSLLDHVEREMRAAATQQLYERASWLRRRARRLGVILNRLGGVLEATHSRPRLILGGHPADSKRLDGFWLIGGRLLDWGPLQLDIQQLQQRTDAALARGGRVGELGAHVPPDEIDEVRLIGKYLSSHADTRQLALEPRPSGDVLAEFVEGLVGGQSANGNSTTRAPAPSAPTETAEPGGASRRTSASAIDPNRGDSATLPTLPTSRPSKLSGSPL
jgi:DNA polymerase-3 subunit epsilon